MATVHSNVVKFFYRLILLEIRLNLKFQIEHHIFTCFFDQKFEYLFFNLECREYDKNLTNSQHKKITTLCIFLFYFRRKEIKTKVLGQTWHNTIYNINI